uniref:Uncharacterized protein n=1 Tax=uncultured marine group II/III euryarchaeote KM3_200_B09 TaxID=1457975 RepID=A0A075GW51_9EURY|nr:hypothetical protein [uncultured marine group II/III euryarchaeote KM3_200_B09]
MVVEASSVTAPVPSDPALGASLAPVIVIVIVCVVPPSALVTTNVSDSEADAARALTVESELSKVYVQVPLDTAYEPYPLTESLDDTSVRVFSPVSTSFTVGVPVAVVVDASSVTAPVLALVSIVAASLVFETTIVKDWVDEPPDASVAVITTE